MLTSEVVLKVRDKAQKNNSNDNQPLDLPRIIIAVNEAQNKYVEWVLIGKNDYTIELIQRLLVSGEALKQDSKTDNSQYFLLPKDIFESNTLYAIAKQGNCKDRMNLWEAKSQNINELLIDDNNKPSFYYRESFYYIGGGKIRVFRDDFLITSLEMSYYRYPKRIDIEGYTDINGAQSSTTHPEWDDSAMDRIIDIAVKDLNINAENFNRMQIDNQRINNEF